MQLASPNTLSTSLLPGDSDRPQAIALSIQDGEDNTQLHQLFDSLDVYHTGHVTFAQISAFLESELSNSTIKLLGIDAATATTLLFQSANSSDNTLTYTQFHEVFRSSLRDSQEAGSMHPVTTRKRQLADWYATHRLRVWWLVAYAVANAVAFWWAFYSYNVDPALRYGLRIARGGAKIAILNAFLVMLPLLRSLTQVLKRSKTLWWFIPFDDAILAHKICGTMCIVGGAIHVGAHVSNIVCLYYYSTPSDIERSIFGQRHVPVFRHGLPPFSTLLTTQPVLTGIVLVVISLISFPLAAIPGIRQGRFNLFWYSHMLFGVLLVVMCFHDAASWVVRATSYVWIVPVASLYLIERRFRYAKMFTDPVKIVEATMLDRACVVYLEKPRRFAYLPGMYLLINCPEISYHEWHPFTISSAPGDNYLSIHMRDAGDWTRAFHKRIADAQSTCSQVEYPVVYLDGPSGAPAEDFHRYATCLCIAGGIGVTPFASILRDCVHRWQLKDQTVATTTRTIYFHWITRGQESLRWFESTMNQIHTLDRDRLIETHQYLTGTQGASLSLPLRTVQRVVHEATGRDTVSGLDARTRTHLGHPDWDQLFQEACRAHAGETVGVFSCGPPSLEKELRRLCKKYSRRTAECTVFDYHPERFA
jgi:respiratory burst oxidase